MSLYLFEQFDHRLLAWNLPKMLLFFEIALSFPFPKRNSCFASSNQEVEKSSLRLAFGGSSLAGLPWIQCHVMYLCVSSRQSPQLSRHSSILSDRRACHCALLPWPPSDRPVMVFCFCGSHLSSSSSQAPAQVHQGVRSFCTWPTTVSSTWPVLTALLGHLWHLWVSVLGWQSLMASSPWQVSHLWQTKISSPTPSKVSFVFFCPPPFPWRIPHPQPLAFKDNNNKLGEGGQLFHLICAFENPFWAIHGGFGNMSSLKSRKGNSSETYRVKALSWAW